MTNKEALTRYAQLNAEMRQQHQIANDIEGNDSDTVIRAKKEIQRIQHDIAYVFEVIAKQ